MRLEDQVVELDRLSGRADGESAVKRAHATFEELGLPRASELGRRFPHQVSGGQLQRFMIAMGLQQSPALLVCDEPTSALDVTTQVEVLNILKEAIRSHQTAALFVSHDLAVVAQIATRIAVLRGGRLIEIGSTEQILFSPIQPYTRELIASSRGFDAGSIVARLPSPNAKALLSVRGVKVSYDKPGKGQPANIALHEASFEVQRGELVAIIGESGSGKSTLARAVAGLHPPFAGKVLLDGKELAGSALDRSKADRHRIQIVFQSADTSLNPKHTVERTLRRVLDFYGDVPVEKRPDRVSELLELVQLPTIYANRRPNQLSGGEKQRVNLARALAAQPEILICDEITSALDNLVAASILKLVDSLRRNLGLGVVFVSHDLAAVAQLADQVMVLRNGRVVEQGSTASVLARPAHPYTQLLKASVPELRTTWLAGAASEQATLRKALAPELPAR
jgi:peptide/nickel transport system ATP-binding protein